METGLAEPKKEQKGEFVLLDEFDDGRGDSEDAASGQGDAEDTDSALRRSESVESRRFGGSEGGLSEGPATKW